MLFISFQPIWNNFNVYFSILQALENPTYDPTLFAQFVPQDAVQQYVSQYAGSYIPQAPYNNAYDPGNFIPSLPIKLHKIIKFAEYFYRKNRCTKRD